LEYTQYVGASNAPIPSSFSYDFTYLQTFQFSTTLSLVDIFVVKALISVFLLVRSFFSKPTRPPSHRWVVCGVQIVQTFILTLAVNSLLRWSSLDVPLLSDVGRRWMEAFTVIGCTQISQEFLDAGIMGYNTLQCIVLALGTTGSAVVCVAISVLLVIIMDYLIIGRLVPFILFTIFATLALVLLLQALVLFPAVFGLMYTTTTQDPGPKSSIALAGIDTKTDVSSPISEDESAMSTADTHKSNLPDPGEDGSAMSTPDMPGDVT